MKYLLIAVSCLSLTACKTSDVPDVVVKTETVRVNVPVHQPCVGTRPDKPKTLSEKFSDADWAAMTGFGALLKAAEAVLDWQAYAEKLDTETSACD